jgi:hypothetical protein
MATSSLSNDFIVWGLDQTAYGPVELPMLVGWVKEERVLADTWIFTCKSSSWQRAQEIPELSMFFGQPPVAAKPGVSARQLRRVKILATMTDEQLERFSRVVDVERIPQWTVVVKQGEHGDSMYLVLEGELRVRMEVMGKETILATLGPGDFFGDIAIFDLGPRAADVVANSDAVLVKVTSKSLDVLGKESPDLSAAFLKAVGRTLTARIRADNKRHSDSVKFNRAAGSP